MKTFIQYLNEVAIGKGHEPAEYHAETHRSGHVTHTYHHDDGTTVGIIEDPKNNNHYVEVRHDGSTSRVGSTIRKNKKKAIGMVGRVASTMRRHDKVHKPNSYSYSTSVGHGVQGKGRSHRAKQALFHGVMKRITKDSGDKFETTHEDDKNYRGAVSFTKTKHTRVAG